MTDDTTPRSDPFTLDIPQADLDDLRDRLDRARWPDELPGDVDDGIKQSYVRSLYDHWRSEYDWRATEARINANPQFTTEIDGQNVHFLHVRSPEPNALPLIVTHGWPGSILEFFDIIGPLSDPRAHGGDAADAFDLVIPSIPGYGLSGPTRERGWSNYRIAAAWVELMRRLGYERYGAAGNDAGSMISPEVGRLDPGPRRRRPRHPALLVPVGRSVRVRGHDARGDDRARDAPVVLREQDVASTRCSRSSRRPWPTGSPTRRSGCSPGTPSSSARTSTRTSSSRT